MTRKEVKALVMRLYDAVQESGWSSHKYTDDKRKFISLAGLMRMASAAFWSAVVFIIGFALIMGGVSMLA